MFACVHPSAAYFEENLSTLTFGAKTSQIANNPVRNDDPRVREIDGLKRMVRSLQNELEKAN
jgi:kinesin family protein 4/21/27